MMRIKKYWTIRRVEKDRLVSLSPFMTLWHHQGLTIFESKEQAERCVRYLKETRLISESLEVVEWIPGTYEEPSFLDELDNDKKSPALQYGGG